MDPRHVVLSGCSGGGKSTLLAELERRGFRTVPEPGRRIVEEELLGTGAALPWIDLAAFARRALEIAAADRTREVGGAGWVFFDRGLVDAAVALAYATGLPAPDALAPYERYHARVFMTPPWPEIHVRDDARRHDLAEGRAEYDRLLIAYRALGYDVLILPKTSVGKRADFVLRHL
ncbi:AAA family ATPase [Aureimonas sp. ME7]|uniref:AAA family ATPase n=1 Tax=Aureimonas sp. ME7 TaxID=2744252 RepID=UPI0015F559CB|nr:AAA family ATPase [Aureimonas sp. ME7]